MRGKEKCVWMPGVRSGKEKGGVMVNKAWKTFAIALLAALISVGCVGWIGNKTEPKQIVVIDTTELEAKINALNTQVEIMCMEILETKNKMSISKKQKEGNK
jgi:uncharacterized protein YcfL